MSTDSLCLDVSPWLKTLPLAPEYHPTLAEFLDPIAYILKIEKEASQYGICKIVPPLPSPPKKSALSNLIRSFSAINNGSDSKKSPPTFSTRKQEVGLCPRRPRPVQRSVWQSGERYTLREFEAKAKQFERTQLLRASNRKFLTPLEVESLFWRASADKPFTVEYANDMPGSGFEQTTEPYLGFSELQDEEDDEDGEEEREREFSDVGKTAWNMRGVSRARGSLLRFMKEEIPGVTSPMVYVAMMYGWFAWHVEDHDLHSLNYLHFGASKTWYGVPRDARLAFEEAVRVHGYGQEVNLLMTFTMLGEKTTVMSPEVLVDAGIPCCRLVQNAGEFVVTFPGAYHSGFSHGFNCAEAANIATPGWLRVAKEAAIRRASTNNPPMVSHYQLLYALALSVWPRVPKTCYMEPRSSRLKDKMKNEGETMVKETFVESVIQNNNLISILLKEESCVILPHGISPGSSVSRDTAKKTTIKLNLAFTCVNTKGTDKLYHSELKNILSGKDDGIESSGFLDQGLLSCVTCGILSFGCVAVVQPSDVAARYLMSNNCSLWNNDQSDGSEENDETFGTSHCDDTNYALASSSGQMRENAHNFALSPCSNNVSDQCDMNRDTALDLLASAYGASDSEEELQDETNVRNDEKIAGGVTGGQSQSEQSNGVGCKSKLKMLRCDRDSCRKHVFCLEHALKVGKELQKIGGFDIILLCHPEYPKVEAEAKLLAEELGMVYEWKEIQFRDATGDDKQRIQSALEDEETIPANSDWAVKMGINLYYSANQSKSPLYSKQMPYNSIIYKVFGQEPINDSQIEPERRSGRQKKIVVAGRWCGRVWMTNQVHPYLMHVNDNNALCDDEHGDEKLYIRVPVQREPVKIEEKSDIGSTSNRSKRVSGLKRKKSKSTGKARNKRQRKDLSIKSDEPSEELPETNSRSCGRVLRSKKKESSTTKVDSHLRKSYEPSEADNKDEFEELVPRSTRNRKQISKIPKQEEPQPKPKPKSKAKQKTKAMILEEEFEFACDIEGCTMSFGSKQDLVLHKKNICPIKGCGKKFFSHKYMIQHKKVHTDDRPLKCPWKGCKMAFKWPWARTEHIRVHTGVRPYVCKESGCGQTFRFVSDFSRHKRKTGHCTKTSRKKL